MPIKVKLRQKPITGNRQALYLDFYPAITDTTTGKETRREFLGLYLLDEVQHELQHYTDGNGKPQKRIVPVLDKKGEPKAAKLNPIEKQQNKELLQRAEQIRNNKENEVNKSEIYTGFEREQLKKAELGERNFVEYFKELADKRKASNHDNWISCYNYLNTYTGGNLKFADLNEKWCNGFKDYLLTTKSNKDKDATLSQNSVVSYFNKLKATLKQAYKDGYLQTNLNSKIDTVKPAETQRNFLTLEELNALVKADCTSPILKQAALFSALTGLRFSDIQKLLWSEVEYIKGNGYFIKFHQQKTKGAEMMPISEQAFSLLGKPKLPGDKVFERLNYTEIHRPLVVWLTKAGITKDITFHCFRHTYATLQISAGTDIYTVSKMLGHRELKTTQVYAKVIDKAKREATAKINLDLS